MFSFFEKVSSARFLILNLTLKELRVKYKHSLLGFFWSLLNPLLTLGIYTVVFKVIMRVQIPHFPLFLLAGLLPWTFFQMSVIQSANGLIANGALLKKVYFARESIPVSIVLTNLVNFLMTFLVLCVGIAISGTGFGWTLILFPVIVVFQVVLVTGFSLLVSVLTARFRDIAHLLEIVLNAWMYMTPVVYPISMVPKRLQWIISLNPLTSYVGLYRDITVYHVWPTMGITLAAAIWATAFFAVGISVFRKLEYSVLDRI